MNKFLLSISLFITSYCFSEPLINQNVVICGICKDIEQQLAYSTEIVENIGALFSDYRVIMYENNSSDHTYKKLENWAQKNPKVYVKSEYLTLAQYREFILNMTKKGSFFRTEAIAKARNEVLDIALSKEYEDYPYLIWIDMDFVKHPNYDAFIDIFHSKQEWDAVFANGVAPDGKYWDWYACRFPGFPFGPEMLAMKWYRCEEKRNAALAITPQSPWLPVYSAFGGCGIYKKASIKDSRYSGVVTQDLENLNTTILEDGIASNHPAVLQYLEECEKLTEIIPIDDKENLKAIRGKDVGVTLFPSLNPVIWRMNTYSYHYPSICEHVPFHAAMIQRGHDQLFICPKLLFYY